MILKGLLDRINEFITQIKEGPKKPTLYTEEDILKAMENLPPEPLKSVGYTNEELNCSVPKVGTWSMFQYLTDSPSGTADSDKKFFYAVPCGREFGSEVRIWYLGVYFNGEYEDTFEFFTLYDFSKE